MRNHFWLLFNSENLFLAFGIVRTDELLAQRDGVHRRVRVLEAVAGGNNQVVRHQGSAALKVAHPTWRRRRGTCHRSDSTPLIPSTRVHHSLLCEVSNSAMWERATMMKSGNADFKCLEMAVWRAMLRKFRPAAMHQNNLGCWQISVEGQFFFLKSDQTKWPFWSFEFK